MSLIKYYSFLTAAFLIVSCNTPPATKGHAVHVDPHNEIWNPEFNISIDSLINKALVDSIIPGAVVLVSIDNKTVYKKAFGYAQIYNYGKRPLKNPVKMTTEHVFDLASLTKVLATTMGIMKLVDSRQVDLDSTVGHYIPQFKSGDKADITIRHLLTHTAGLKPWKPLYFQADNSTTTLEYIAKLPRAYPIDKERHYSDLGFMLLGNLIEKVSGMRLNEYLNKVIFAALELDHTSFNPNEKGWKFAATSHGNPFEYKMVADDDFGYKCDENIEDFERWRAYTLIGEVNDGNSFYANEGIAGHAGLFSTVDDIQKLLQMLLDEGRFNGKRVFSKEVIQTFLTRDTFDNGLGWAMSTEVLPVTKLPEGAFGHTGFTGTYVLCLPEHSLSLVVLTNRQNLDVNESGRYNSVTSLRKSLSDFIIQNTN